MTGGQKIKRKDLDRLMTKAGYVIKHGGNHDKYIKGNQTIPVPRAKEIKEGTASGIMKAAGIKN
jgi:predicted RNA binding protein YcfA (HicA-like mRNA interferase family)